MTTYTDKIVDGVSVPLTQQEIADLQARDAAWTPPIPQSVTAAQGRLALSAAGKRDAVEAAVNAAAQDVQDYWHYSPYLQRQHPVITSMATGLGWSSADLDTLFTAAAAFA